jgi:glycosyltransferase involved in cell wall biosynthesis
MPLAKDRFNEGKCAYKLLQYLACGKPVIATPWGMNIDVIHDEKIGFLADNNSEWLNQIKYYIDNKKVVDMHSDYRKDIIKKNYTISSKIDSIKEILKNCN